MYRLGAIIGLCVAVFSLFVSYASEQGNEDAQRGDLAPHLWAMQMLRRNGLKKEGAGYFEPLEPIPSNSPRHDPSVDSPRTTREDPVLNRRNGSKNIQPPQLVPKEEDTNIG